jgi:serine/threonine protein kinase
MTTPDTTGQWEEFPEILGYDILGELGRGGMGVVYKARQVHRDRLVALKMILTGRGASVFHLARFRVEAESIACLDHPNIIRIHEVGVHGGCPYLALEFAEGGNLARPVHGAARPPRWAAEVVKSLASAMQMAHDRGILHRDLKPANVLLTADSTPKIADFGLAKFQRPMRDVSDMCATISVSALDAELFQFVRDYQQQKGAGSKSMDDYLIERTWKDVMGGGQTALEESGLIRVKEFVTAASRQACAEPPASMSSLLADLTKAGTILGSPHYMAPEQAAGNNWGIGPATDIYGLGAVLYYLLTGHPPFEGTDFWQVINQVQNEAPLPIEPRVNRELEAICLRCLEKLVDRRYATAAALAEDVERFLDGYAARASVEHCEEGHPSCFRGAAPQEKVVSQSDPWSPHQTDPHKTKSWWQIWK